MNHFGDSNNNIGGGPAEKKLIESPLRPRTSEPKEVDRLKGDQNFTTNAENGMNVSIKGLGSRLVVNVEATKIEKFFVDGLAFTQLSDHYGISAQLEII